MYNDSTPNTQGRRVVNNAIIGRSWNTIAAVGRELIDELLQLVVTQIKQTQGAGYRQLGYCSNTQTADNKPCIHCAVFERGRGGGKTQVTRGNVVQLNTKTSEHIGCCHCSARSLSA